MEQDIIITEEQAKNFARSCYKDISAYVQNHQKEYQEFLSENNNSEGKDENVTKRKRQGK